MESTYFTIFTSVYNRKHTVHRVWESLNAQTYKNFEWVLINNGSTDGVEPLLEEYKSKANFKVRLYHQENKGKYMAFDRCIDLAEGELAIPADSDDRFDDNTLERLNEVWNKYKADDVSGITVLCRYKNGSIVGEKFPVDGISTFENIVYKHNVGGEKWGCVRVDLLRKYRFPKTFDVKFFPDIYVWGQIGFNYKTVFLNEPLRLYYQDAGNQITKDIKRSKEVWRMQNFFTTWRINYLFPRIEKYLSFSEYFRMFVFLWISAFKSDKSVFYTVNSIKRPKSKFWLIMLLIPSFIINAFGLKLNFLKRRQYKYQVESF